MEGATLLKSISSNIYLQMYISYDVKLVSLNVLPVINWGTGVLGDVESPGSAEFDLNF